MKARYFSPISKITSASSSSSEQDKMLKKIGSTTKLLIYSKTINQPEQRIGKYTYRLDRILGEGFSSKVYYGYLSDNPDEECAVKAIDLRKFRSSDIQMLENQIQILGQIDHPNTIQLYEVIKTKNFCYIITQLCQHDDLRTHLLHHGKLSEKQALTILHDIVEGYKYLSRNSILHRDLKPANILKGKYNWKIADFGFAIKTELKHKSKGNVGTPLYMPPESLVRNLYSASTDIFSIGIIFYEMLTGRTPWEATTEKELLRKMINNPVQVDKKYSFSEEINRILEKFCCVDAKKRMEKDQFSKFTVHTVYNEATLRLGNVTSAVNNPETLQLANSLNLAVFSSPKNHMKMIITNPKKSQRTDRTSKRNNKSIQKKKFIELSEVASIYNNKILVNQLHYCRFINYIIQNSPYFLLPSEQKTKLSILLYRHLLELIARLSDTKKNWFSLENWKDFIISKRYSETSSTLKEYLNRYEQQYKTYCKSLDSDEVHQINSELQQACDSQFSVDFYQFMKSQVTIFIKGYKRLLDLEVLKKQDCKELRGQIQGIRSLVKYRKLILFSLNHFQKFDDFEKKSDIKVQNDYHSVTSATKAGYSQLCKDLVFL